MAASHTFITNTSLAPQVQPGKENLVVCLQHTPSGAELLCEFAVAADRLPDRLVP